MPLLLCTTFLVSTTFAVTPAHAQSWTGTTSSDWFTGTNWNPNGVPAAGASVSIDTQTPNAAVVNGGATPAMASLSIGDINSGTLTIQNGGSVTVTSNNDVFVGNLAGSSGTVTVTGAGSTWTGGVLFIGNLGTGKLTIQNGGAVSDVGGAFVGFSAGSQGTVIVDNGTWNASTHLDIGEAGSGVMTIQNGGTVSSFDALIGISAGSTGAVVVNNGSWNNASTLSVGYLGTGTLTLQNGGTVNTGAVTLANLAGSSAMLNIGAAPGSPAAAPGTLNTPTVSFGSGFAQINFNHTSTNYAFAPALSGIGTLNQRAGTTILTADSSGFTGATNVAGGRLIVNGSLAGSNVLLSFNGSGVLGGDGTVGGIWAAGGSVSPGNGIGTLHVTNNVIFGVGSIYQVEANAAGQSDKIVAGGTGTINGGSVQVLAGMGNYAPATTYTILTAAGGRSGAFDTVTSNLAFLDPSLSYDPTNVYLTLTRNNTSFAAVGITPNQIATGGAVDGLAFGNPVYNAVLNLSSVQARSAFDQLSGEIHASARTVMVEDSRFARDAALDRLRAAFDDVGAVRMPVMAYTDGGPMLAPATTDRIALWARGFGAWGTIAGDGNAATLKRDIGGFFAGADGLITEAIRLGVLGGYSHSSFRVAERASSARSDNYHLGVYGGSHWGDLAVRSGAALTWHDISTSRSVVFPGFVDSLTGQYTARTAQIFGDIGYAVRAGQLGFEPFANLAYVNVASGAFTEKGGTAALTSRDDKTDVTLTTLGLRASGVFAPGNGPFMTARGMLGWRHAFADVTPLSTFAFAGGMPFGITGTPIARDAAVLDFGLDLKLTPSALFAVSYGGQFSRGLTDQSVKGSFAWTF